MQTLIHIALLYFVKRSGIGYFDSFGVEHVPKQIKKFIGNKNTPTSKQFNNEWVLLHWIH